MTDTKSLNFQPFRDNASIKNLSKEGVVIDIIKLEPNSSFDEHVHEEPEWLYVLDGSFSDKNGVYSKGHYVFNAQGSKHATKSGEKGCEVLVIKQAK